MNDLDVFRTACPRVVPLDDAAAEQIRRAVFGDDAGVRDSRSWVRPVAIAAALAVAAAAVVALVIIRHDGTRSISPAVPSSADAVPTVPSAVAASTTTPAEDWRDRPALRFQPSAEWNALMEQAREANIGRCMTAAGYEYHGNPYQTDTEAGTAAPGIQAGTYEAAFFGVGGQGGGCLDQAYATIFGPVRADVSAENIRSRAFSEWLHAAYADTEVLAALKVLATCARGHGVSVRDVASSPSKALKDIDSGMSEQTVNDPRLAEVQTTTPDQHYVHSMAEMRAVADTVQNEWCPTYTAFYDLLSARSSDAAVVWIEANPQTMAGIDTEFAEDAARFRYIIDHDGDLPPS